MTRSTQVGVLIALCVGLLVVVLLATGSSDTQADVAIDFECNSNSLQGAVAVLRLSNHGNATVRMNAYCTIYWTNRIGVATNTFYKHDQGYAIVRPGQSSLVAVPHPSDAAVWETSFTYQIRPDAMTRVLNQIRFMMPGDWVPDNSFIGRFGPLITNATFAAKDAAVRKN